MGILQWDRNLKVRIIGETINSILFWMFFPFLMLYFVDQFGEKLAGILMIIPPIIGVISNLYGGYAADKYGRKRMMVISLGLQSLFLLIFALSPSPWIDYFCFIGLSIMGSFYHPASMAMVADLVPVDKRRPVFAIFYTSVNLGVVIGASLGGFFFFDYRRQLILTAAIITFFIFIFMVKILRETLPDSAKNAKLDLITQVKNYKIIFTDKVFFIYITAGVLISQVFMQMDLFLGLYLKKYVPHQTMDLGFVNINVTGERLFGWLISENGLIVVLFSVLVARLISKWSDEKALIISSLLFGFSFWLMGFTTSALVLILLMGLFTLAELIRTPVIQNFITKIAPEDKRGQYLGASSLQFSIGRAIAPLSVFLSAYYSPFVIFSIIFGCSILSAILYKWMFVIYNKRVNNEQLVNSSQTTVNSNQ